MSGLYHRSLQEISLQEKRSGGRGSPYSRPSSTTRPSSDDKWQHDRFSDSTTRDGNRRERVRASDLPSQKLLVEGIHYEISNAELESLFQQIGPTEKCFIKYDKSGRSTGTATIIYKQVNDAVKAKREYDGANAKGQPIQINFEVYREFAPRGTVAGLNSMSAAPSGKGADLMSRLGGGDLSSRIAGNHASRGIVPKNAPKGPANATMQSRPGPERIISGESLGRSAGRFRGRGGRGRGGGRGPPPTASNLDAELDAFMKAPPPADKQGDNDVDMA